MFAALLLTAAADPGGFVVVNRCPPPAQAFTVVNRCPPVRSGYWEDPATWQTPATPLVRATVGVHTHTCPRCGTSWTHTDASFGSVADHTCPTCGALVWGNITNRAKAAVPTYAPPGGFGGPYGGTRYCPPGSFR